MKRLIFAALAALALTACAGVSSPDGWAPPRTTDGVLYVTLNRGELSALDGETFEEIWVFGAEDEFACGNEGEELHDLDGIYGAPAAGEGFVYIGAYDGAVYAVNAEDGSCAWRFETGDPIVGAPVLGDGVLYAPSTDGKLYLLDPETGAEARPPFSAGDVWAAPLLTGDAFYVSTMEGRVWKLDPGTLESDWRFETSAGLLTTPLLTAGDPATVVVGGVGRKLFGISDADGAELWSFKAGNWFWGQPVLDGGTVYATSLDGKVYAVDAGSGQEAWSFDTGSPIRAGAVILGENVVVVNNDGDAYGLNKGTGDVVWGPTELAKSVYADPIVHAGAVLVVTRGGDVISISADGRPTTVVRS